MEVNYVLFIDVTTRRSGYGWVVPDLLIFLGALPAIATNELSATATLYEAATTKDLAVYDAKGQLKTAFWLPLVLAAPLSAAFGATLNEVYRDTFRDIFAQLARDLNRRPLPPAVQDSDLRVRRVDPVPQVRLERRSSRPALSD